LLCRCLAVQREMGPVFVVLGFPAFDLSTEIPFVLERTFSIELLRVGFVATFDLTVYLWASRWYVPMGDFEIAKMPGELWTKRRVIVGLNLLDRQGKMLADFLQEVHRCLGVVVIIDAQHAKECGFIDRRELIEALASSSQSRDELHVELDRSPWNGKRSIYRFRAWAILLQRYSAYVMAMEDFEDGRG